jgi:hypothetical protein
VARAPHLNGLFSPSLEGLYSAVVRAINTIGAVNLGAQFKGLFALFAKTVLLFFNNRLHQLQ